MKDLIIIFTSVVLLVIMAASCSPQRRLGRLATGHPDAAAEICARMFPVTESSTVRIRTVRDTFQRPGQVYYVDCDSVLRAVNLGTSPSNFGSRSSKVAVKCPDQLTIVDTIFRDSIVVQESTASLTSMTAKKDSATVEAAILKSSRNIWRWAAIILGAYSIIRLVLRYWLKFSLP